MLDNFIIVGLTMVIVGILKTYKPFLTARGKLYISLLVFDVVATLNALIFGGILIDALREGFILGAATGGIYSNGKKQLEKFKATPDPAPTSIT